MLNILTVIHPIKIQQANVMPSALLMILQNIFFHEYRPHITMKIFVNSLNHLILLQLEKTRCYVNAIGDNANLHVFNNNDAQNNIHEYGNKF